MHHMIIWIVQMKCHKKKSPIHTDLIRFFEAFLIESVDTSILMSLYSVKNRFNEIPEVHGVSHNLLHTDWTRPSLILLNSSVNWVQVDLNKEILSQRLTQWMIGKSLLQHSSWLAQHPSGFQAANYRPQNRSLSPFQPSKISAILKKLNFWKRLKTLIHSFKSLYVTRNLTKSLL